MTTTIGITGADGFIGWHLRCFLLGVPGVDVRGIGREQFASASELEAFVSACDAIVHLAGMNRGDEKTVHRTNIEIATRLIEACQDANAVPHVLFASSTHIYRQTVYGESKQACTELFHRWAAKSGARFTNLVLPNIFGEHGQPFYNSVVSTFCHQVAVGDTPEIIDDIETEQMHAQELCERIWDIIDTGETGEQKFSGQPVTVSALRHKIISMADGYGRHIIPTLDNNFDLCLFNTYRSYLIPDHYPVPLTLHQDDRGDLFEVVKTHHGGQAFMSTTHPGITRGEHYHRRKVERFVIVKGEAIIRLRRLFHGEITAYRICADTPFYVDIPTLHTHNLTNIGEQELITLFWANEIFDPEHPDTFSEPVGETHDTV